MTDAQYEIIDTPLPRVGEDTETAARGATRDQVMAIEQYNAVEFRNETGGTFHRYDLPGSQVLQSPFRHYFRYFGLRYHELNPRQLKFRFVQYALQILRKIAVHRKTASVLEIGSTLGENYLMLQDAQRLEGMDLSVEFVGLDIDATAVALARELFCGDRTFQSILGEGSDLCRFPDRAFDLVISNGVHNILQNPAEGIREAMRVARVAVLLHVMTTADTKGQPINLRSPFSKLIYQVFPLSDLVGHLRSARPFYLYWPSRYWPFTDRTHPWSDDGRYLDKVDEKSIRWDMVIVSRLPLFPGIPQQFVRHFAP